MMPTLQETICLFTENFTLANRHKEYLFVYRMIMKCYIKIISLFTDVTYCRYFVYYYYIYMPCIY